jgi:ferrochelatase
VRELVVAPIGFLCDHVEVLYDLDVEARATANDCGIRLSRAGTVGDHPAFIEMLAEMVRAKVEPPCA